MSKYNNKVKNHLCLLIDHHFFISVIPMEILLFWRNYPIPFGEVGCDLAIVISEMVNYVSILTMIAFTIER